MILRTQAAGVRSQSAARSKQRRLRGEEQVRILAARPIGSSGGGVDHQNSPSLAIRIELVRFHYRPDCVKTVGSEKMGAAFVWTAWSPALYVGAASD